MQSLYFIAIIPDTDLSKEITALKKQLAEKYNSKAALKLPPHITLYPPFKWDHKNEDSIINALTNFVNGKENFIVSLNGLGCFEPRVIFIKPDPSEKLGKLRTDLLTFLKTSISLSDPQNERPFRPHITLASRDLQKEDFYKAWEEFRDKEFKRMLEVNSIALLKHDGKFWDVLKEFPFK
jgi:2'-5' RNA ligase